MYTLTLAYPTVEELHAAVCLLAGRSPAIAHEDRPDVGVVVAPLPPAPAPVMPPPADPAAVFGGAAAQVPPPPVPSTAAAAASPTALAVPTPGLPPPVPAPLPPAPPSAPAAAAPSAPAAPTNPAAGAVALDRDGLPWDQRIHASTKTLNADGTWRQKRGTAETYVNQVKAELRAAMGAGGAAPAAPPLLPAVAATPAGPAPTDMGGLMSAMAPHIESGRLTNLAIASILGEFGIPSWFALAPRPDLVPAVYAKFQAHLAGLPA